MPTNPVTATINTWSQLANEQSYNEMTLANLNSNTIPTVYDPIYEKLIMQISDTIYREMRVEQRWSNIGATAPMNEYPGILREIYMERRKGMDYAMDRDPRPNQLNVYNVIDDEIQVRYHAAQFRWMYGWTLFDEELRRFSGGNGNMIARLSELKAINAASSRNMFIDALRKQVLYILATQVAKEVETDIDISEFGTLTQAQAKEWLNMLDNMIFEMYTGTTKYSPTGEFIQIPRDRLQIVMPYSFWNTLVRTAFPDTYHIEYFQNILPENMILIDTMGGDQVALTGTPTTPITPTFDAQGMNLLNWSADTHVIIPDTNNIQCVIFDRYALGFEDNLMETHIGPKDIEKLAAPVRMHYWTKAYVTDMLPSVAIKFNG